MDGSSSQCDIALATFLCGGPNAGIPSFELGDFLWNSSLDELQLDDDQVVAILTEAFVRHYMKADQQLPMFEDEFFDAPVLAVEVT